MFEKNRQAGRGGTEGRDKAEEFGRFLQLLGQEVMTVCAEAVAEGSAHSAFTLSSRIGFSLYV